MNTRAISCLLFLLLGCGASYQSEGNAEFFAAKRGEAIAEVDAPGGGEPGADKVENEVVNVESADRKIIYEATISLVVEDFEAASQDILLLVEKYQGYLGETAVDRTQGSFRTGRWIVRIPVEKFSDCLAELAEIGVAERQGQTALDVTMEYLDVEARIKTKKELEKRILDLLADRSGKLQDVIAAEQELARVRSDIESMEGRLRYLQNRTSFSTVTIDVREEKDYVPPKAPTVGDRIAMVWTRSWDSLKDAGIGLVLAGVAFAPWILPTALAIFIGYFVLRTVYRKVRRRFFETAEG